MATTEKASGYVDNESPKQDKGKDASSNGQNQTDSVPSAQLLKAKKIGHRRVDKSTGQITYKKTPSSALSGSIQLGISHTVAGLNVKPERDVLMQDFQVVETYHFPPEGSNVTPAHHFGDFTFRTYAPTAFRYFRDLFGIQPDDYMLSIGQHPLTELSNPGASGSLFYVTHDDKYIIKTVQHKEAEFLQKLLPGYYMNLVQNPRTFLPKFYGLYCVQSSGKNIRVVVMNNLLPRTINMHLKYDLKGSTYKRKASKHERAKKHPTFKDLDLISDFPEGVLLEQDIHTVLIKTIDRDCLVLRSFKIMDYSLLLAIHKIEDPEKERTLKSAEHLPQGSAESFPSSSNDGDGARPSGSDLNQILGGTLLRSKYSNDIHHWSGGIPAKTTHGKNVLLFCGIIDILQCYKFKKKIEHTWKSVIADGDTVSVHRPGFYCERFQKFMSDHVFRKSVVKTQPTKQSRSQISRKIGYSSSSAAKSTSPKVAMRGAGKLSKLPDVLPNEAAESHQTEDDKHSELHAHASASSIGEVDSRMLHTIKYIDPEGKHILVSKIIIGQLVKLLTEYRHKHVRAEMSSHGDEESQTKILGDRDSSADVQSSSEEKSSPSNTDVSGKGDLGAQPSTIDEVNLVLEDEHETNSDEPTTSVSDELRLNSITSFSSVGITVSVGPPSDKEEDTLL